RFIDANKDGPFYINVWTLVPHATLHPTEEQMQPYLRFGPRGVPYKGASRIYYSSVTDLDAQVGRLMAKLDETKLAGNTLVIFSSDNGPEDIYINNANHSGIGSAGPLRGRKRSLYEGGVRVPFIVRWPGKTPAGRIDDSSVIAGVDFLPTIASIAGVELPSAMKPDGEDRSAALLGKPAPRTKALFWEWRFRIFGHVSNMSPMLAVRDGKWKLLMNPDRGRIELYDIPRDPREKNNIADANPSVVRRLSEKALAWQKTLPKGMVEPAAGKDDYPWPGR
ncbi:MAG: sulfatase-like hydrolase/transferase, partial [bacterium]|nr:sulfatase-like hydrolase/transferase [bacterium]